MSGVATLYIKLEEKVKESILKQLSLSNGGLLSVIGGGEISHFYLFNCRAKPSANRYMELTQAKARCFIVGN